MTAKLDYKTEQKVITLVIIIGFIVSTFAIIMIFKSKHTSEYEQATTKIETIDENTIEFFIGDNLLDKTYNKIKNEKFNEIDLVDKQKINDMLEWYNENGHKYISIDGTKIKLNNFLKNNDVEIKKYLSSIDDEIKYFTIFYKIVINKNTSYTKYLNKNVNEKLIKQAVKNKQIIDIRDNYFANILFMAAISTMIIAMIAIFILDTIVLSDR